MAIIRAKVEQVVGTSTSQFEFWAEQYGYNILVYTENSQFIAVLTSDRERCAKYSSSRFVTCLEGTAFFGTGNSETVAIESLANSIQGKQYKHIAFGEGECYTADF